MVFYYIIHKKAVKANSPTTYSIVQKNGNIRISQTDAPAKFRNLVTNNARIVDFDDYYDTFHKTITNRSSFIRRDDEK